MNKISSYNHLPIPITHKGYTPTPYVLLTCRYVYTTITGYSLVAYGDSLFVSSRCSIVAALDNTSNGDSLSIILCRVLPTRLFRLLLRTQYQTRVYTNIYYVVDVLLLFSYVRDTTVPVRCVIRVANTTTQMPRGLTCSQTDSVVVSRDWGTSQYGRGERVYVRARAPLSAAYV